MREVEVNIMVGVDTDEDGAVEDDEVCRNGNCYRRRCMPTRCSYSILMAVTVATPEFSQI